MRWSIAYIGLGSNMGDRISYIYKALKEIDTDPEMVVEDASSIYETDPYGPVKQADFLNLAVKISTVYSPDQLLQRLLQVEAALDRIREVHWGPRTIDLDILLYNHENIEMKHLKIPHPELTRRAFVLIPLKEMAPHLKIPTTERTIAELAEPFEKERSVRLWRKQNPTKEFGLF